MQILQWLFKAPQSHSHSSSAPVTRSRSRKGPRAEEESNPSELVLYKGFRQSEEEVETKKSLTILFRKEDTISRTCYYNTLQLNHLKSLCNYRQDLLYSGIIGDQLGMGHKVAESAANVGCKVLPICDVASLGSNVSDGITDGMENDVRKSSERRRTVSRMKELLRWAAAAKSGKGGSKAWKVLYFRNRAALKAPNNDDSSSNTSKISFRWDVGSCSTTSSVYTPMSLSSITSKHSQMRANNSTSNPTTGLHSSECETITPRSSNTDEYCVKTGQWITTDSEFVVLEL